MSGRALALILLAGLGACQSSSVDPWSAGQLLMQLSDARATLPCVSDPLLYLRTLRPRLERAGEMPADHLCRRDQAACVEAARRDFCASPLAEELRREAPEFSAD